MAILSKPEQKKLHTSCGLVSPTLSNVKSLCGLVIKQRCADNSFDEITLNILLYIC
jgi:hypothetical protein